MPHPLIDPAASPTMTFDWGVIKALVATDTTAGAEVSVVHVVLLPGKRHERHNHPDSDEVIYVLAGEGVQMVADGEPFAIHAGQAVYVPRGAFHSTANRGWEPLSLLGVYGPPGAEQALKGLPDYREVAAGDVPRLERA